MGKLMAMNDYKERFGPNNIMNMCDVLIDEVAMSNIHPRKETNTMNDSWDLAMLDELKENMLPPTLQKIEIAKSHK